MEVGVPQKLDRFLLIVQARASVDARRCYGPRMVDSWISFFSSRLRPSIMKRKAEATVVEQVPAKVAKDHQVDENKDNKEVKVTLAAGFPLPLKACEGSKVVWEPCASNESLESKVDFCQWSLSPTCKTRWSASDLKQVPCVYLNAGNLKPESIEKLTKWAETQGAKSAETGEALPVGLVYFEAVPLANQELWNKLRAAKVGDVLQRSGKCWTSECGDREMLVRCLSTQAVEDMGNWTETGAGQLEVSEFRNRKWRKLTKCSPLDFLLIHQLGAEAGIRASLARPKAGLKYFLEGDHRGEGLGGCRWAEPFTMEIVATKLAKVGFPMSAASLGRFSVGYTTLVYVKSKPLNDATKFE